MEIRKVQKQDIYGIKEIADSLIVTLEDTERKMGFYNYSLNEKQYGRRIESDFFFVGNNHSELEGFCMAYNSEFIKKLIEQEPKLREDVVFTYLSKLQEDYVYVDQLAVRKPQTFIGSKCACRLVDKLKQEALGKTIIAVVPHYPWKNNSAIKFHEHQGTKLVEEIGTKETIVFGVYLINST